MRHLVASLSLLIALAAAPALAQDAFDGAGETAVLDRVNEIRAQAGAGALTRDPALDSAARTHSQDMASVDQLMHVSPTTGTPIDRVHAVGHETGEVAENVAMHTTALEAQQALEASDAHLANMLNPRFTHVGLAVARDEGGVYVTQVFARIEAVEAPAPAVEAPVVAPAVAAPPIAAQPLTAEPIPAAPVQAQAAPIVAAPPPPVASGAQIGAPGQVVTVRTAEGSTAFWVCGSGRWWYYPMPAGTRAGQLQADVSVVGAPPGFGACAPGATGTVAIGGGQAPAAAYGTQAYGPQPAPQGPVYSRPRVVTPGSVGPYYGGPQPYGRTYVPAPAYGPQPYGGTYAPAPAYGPQPYGRRVILVR